MSEITEISKETYRQNAKEKESLKEEAGWDLLSKALQVSDPDAEGEIQQVENKASLEKMLATLKDNEREVLEKRFFDDLTHKEIGKAMGFSLERARVIESRALSKLRMRMYADER